jgi:nicotinamide riboside kinase
MIKIIAIVGPESSGKSELAKKLAQHFQEPLVLEFSREYLDQTNGHYSIDDLAIIAKGQSKKEKDAKTGAKCFIISDTSNVDIQVWSIIKYNKIATGILSHYNKDSEIFYLLTKPDIPYALDPLRERPNIEDRIKIYNTFHSILSGKNNFLGIIDGIGEIRFKNAIELIKYKIKL